MTSPPSTSVPPSGHRHIVAQPSWSGPVPRLRGSKGSADPEEWAKLIKSIKRENQRCIYENDDVLVTHSFNTYASGDKEALLMVHKKTDGLFWRSESGATPIK